MTDFRYRFRPRYYEIDRQGVLFNMWYLGYVDTAQLLPTVDIPEIAFPFGVPSVGPFGGSSSAAGTSSPRLRAMCTAASDCTVITEI